MNKLLKFSMIAALICIMFSCKEDDAKEEVVIPAYVEVALADQIQSFFGDADTKKVTLKANREVELIVPSVDWLVAKIDTADLTTGTATISITVTKNTEAFKGRSTTIAIALKPLKEGDNVSGSTAKATIEVKQSLFGLPIADLLDLSFTAAGVTDISPLNNPVQDVLPNSTPITGAIGGDFPEGWPKVFPTMIQNTLYGGYVAHFSGPQDGERGSCAYRVDIADYSKVTPAYQSAPIPLNEIGKALTKEFSIECLFKRELLKYTADEVKYTGSRVVDSEKNNRRCYLFSATQSFGVGLQIESPSDANPFEEAKLRLYTETTDTPDIPQGGAGGKIVRATYETIIQFETYYHAIGTYKFEDNQGTLVLYVDGEEVARERTDVGYNIKMAAYNHTDALAQWFCIGGDSRRADLSITNHVSDNFENWAERVFSGEIAVARIYGHALTQEDVSALYNFHKPE
jgi:hypothetical protein